MYDSASAACYRFLHITAGPCDNYAFPLIYDELPEVTSGAIAPEEPVAITESIFDELSVSYGDRAVQIGAEPGFIGGQDDSAVCPIVNHPDRNSRRIWQGCLAGWGRQHESKQQGFPGVLTLQELCPWPAEPSRASESSQVHACQCRGPGRVVKPGLGCLGSRGRLVRAGWLMTSASCGASSLEWGGTEGGKCSVASDENAALPSCHRAPASIGAAARSVCFCVHRCALGEALDLRDRGRLGG